MVGHITRVAILSSLAGCLSGASWKAWDGISMEEFMSAAMTACEEASCGDDCTVWTSLIKNPPDCDFNANDALECISQAWTCNPSMTTEEGVITGGGTYIATGPSSCDYVYDCYDTDYGTYEYD